MPNRISTGVQAHSPTYPFTAIVGQEEMKLALVLNAVDPLLGGVLIMGHRGTGKSTAVRSLAALLPDIKVIADCPYRCEPSNYSDACADCRQKSRKHIELRALKSQVRVVDLPLGATEDRVCGTIDIERALSEGTRSFEPGLLARANRGFLYVDEVNLLDDHLVDLLLDVSVTGINRVERESISMEHPARFVLVGSGNPEEGDLRPQLLDRFALNVEVATENALEQRLEVLQRHEEFERDPGTFAERFEQEQTRLRRRISRGRTLFPSVTVDRGILRKVAQLSTELNLDGHRGELTLTRAARALAALEGRSKVKLDDVKRVAQMSLRHRLRRQPFDEGSGGSRIEHAMEKAFASENTGAHLQASGSDVLGNGAGAPAKSTDEAKRATATFAGSRNVGSAGQLPNVKPEVMGPRGTSKSAARRKPSLKTEHNSERGRYSRATSKRADSLTIAIDATIRAVAAAGRSTNATISAESLRYKQFKRRAGSLYVLVVDTSGSMAARRIERAREIAISLLRRAYIHRDSVAIVVFRGATAEEVLPPSRSILRAKRALESLEIGGGTPLSAGVLRALELVKRASTTHGEPVLLLFTDGGANVPLSPAPVSDRSKRATLIAEELAKLGSELRSEKIASVVISTGNRFTNDARAIAEQLGAQYFG